MLIREKNGQSVVKYRSGNRGLRVCRARGCILVLHQTAIHEHHHEAHGETRCKQSVQKEGITIRSDRLRRPETGPVGGEMGGIVRKLLQIRPLTTSKTKQKRENNGRIKDDETHESSWKTQLWNNEEWNTAVTKRHGSGVSFVRNSSLFLHSTLRQSSKW